jgi:AraC-like DNA-binding protein
VMGMNPSSRRVARIESPSGVFCVLEAERGFEMHRSTCPDGQFWLSPHAAWTIERDEQKKCNGNTTYYAPREYCRRVSEIHHQSIGIQVKSALLKQIVSNEESRIRDIEWNLQRKLIQISHCWRAGLLDPDVLENMVSELPMEGCDTAIGSWLSEVRDAAADLLDSPLDLRQLSQLVQVSPSHVCTAFRKAYGVSISEFRQQVRLQKTIDMASRRSLSIYEAANECGFYDASHFYRVVRKDMNLTPADLQAVIGSQSKFRTRHEAVEHFMI